MKQRLKQKLKRLEAKITRLETIESYWLNSDYVELRRKASFLERMIDEAF